MLPDHITILREVFARVLEDYAYLFADGDEAPPAGGAPPAADGQYLSAEMGFEGPLEGRLSMAAPQGFARQVAANVLGLEVDELPGENSAFDAVKELLNVTCGNLLTALAGDEPVFDLTVPQVRPLAEAQWRAARMKPGGIEVVADQWPVVLRLAVAPKQQGHGQKQDEQ